MRRPTTIEKLYLDFDGFFASVMQQAMPALRGRPVGVIPFPTNHTASTIVIACSREAKAAGCKNIMPVPDAMALCPDMVLVPQRPDLYRRAHTALLAEIGCEIPIETVKSIDELVCGLDTRTAADPHDMAGRIKRRLAANVGPYITCSIGFAANRMLAKIACKVDKPNGVTIWRPQDMPGPLIARPMSDVPGIGRRMDARLGAAGIATIADLLAAEPKRLRALWGSVTGERMWYALHGYDLHAMPTARGQFGHSRVLPPDYRAPAEARSCSRLLLTKAARRMRRAGFRAGRLSLWMGTRDGGWAGDRRLPAVLDDQACLRALEALWDQAMAKIPARARIVQVGVMLGDLTPASQRQTDMLLADDADRRRCETLTNTIDALNLKFGKRVVTIGAWAPPPGGYAGGKIAYNRIPSAEDFW